ncbi:MAG TPA: prepilin peptidase [Pseudobacteroides sp.]|uniref:A24 family peptidase n=1 Tax=Pseudobacteroides sp. TaxID=1968840 RepID=UPI002F9335BB
MAIKFTALFILLLLAVFNDIKSFKIKNLITYPAVSLGFVVNTCLRGAEGFKDSISGAIIPLIVLFIFFALRMLGAGDIKLFCAIGALMGWKFSVLCIAYSFIFGGFISIIILLYRKNTKQRFKHLFDYLKTTLLLMKIDKYQDYNNNKNGLFRFSFAVLGGTLSVVIELFIFNSIF